MDKDLKKAVEIKEGNYMDLFKNGARTLFDLGEEFRFLDGSNYDNTPETSFIVLQFYTEVGTRFFQLDARTMYEFVTLFHYCPKKFRDEAIYELMEEIGIINR